jgi:hypothetical protein
MFETLRRGLSSSNVSEGHYEIRISNARSDGVVTVSCDVMVSEMATPASKFQVLKRRGIKQGFKLILNTARDSVLVALCSVTSEPSWPTTYIKGPFGYKL